jgi:hypothetical protein
MEKNIVKKLVFNIIVLDHLELVLLMLFQEQRLASCADSELPCADAELPTQFNSTTSVY